jgi:beta-phosphoglucomutase
LNHIGLLFDMDGVIIDNHEFHFLAWQKLANKYHIKISEEFYREKMNGRTLMELMEVVFKQEMSKDEARSIGLEKEEIYRTLYKSSLAPTAGLIDFLELAKNNKIPMAVGTSAPEENVIFTLDGLGIRHYFDAVFDDRSVTKGKPNPEIYQKCAAGIERENKNCIVFEDAISGIKAGENAGSKVIALATSHSREELSADLIIDDFTGLNLEQIVQLIDKK